jgi:outer membrane murein-binding lipoprotein Lpp
MSDTITPEERIEWHKQHCGEKEWPFDRLISKRMTRLLNALEAAESNAEKAKARVKVRDNHICTLLREALENERNFDGMKSQWQTSEAEVARLNKMVDWLAAELSGGCSTSRCIYDGATEACPIECGGHAAGHWKEAARNAVAVEGK